ncbi:hypothetical protein AXG55_12900 [Silvanigrella aquatica]|uniref:Uncharacterized protein n=1 Tax=Silvanigrella aquatica TaxID=1915309 RepID=A0A1L4D3G2_9BACT|nr:hypothetical protein AXG55_12900 [Silvanigrella aquatica]
MSFHSNSYSIANDLNYRKNQKPKEELPFVVFICENYNKKEEKIRINYNKNIVQHISHFQFVPHSSWATDSQNILKKQQETEFQLLGSKSWPPQVPFGISPLINKKGLIVFINYSGEMASKFNPISAKFVLFYNNKVFLGTSEKDIEDALTEELPKLNKRDGIRLYIGKEVSGNDLAELENVIKNFTANKNSIMIPYAVTAEEVRYHSDIETSQIMRAIKQINQFVPHLSARIASGTNDIIEVSKSQ